MLKVLLLLLGALVSAFRSHADLVLEIPALRRLWARWSDVLIFVKPETVIR